MSSPRRVLRLPPMPLLLLTLLPATSLCEDAALVVRKCCKRGQALRYPDFKCIDRDGVSEVGDWLYPNGKMETLDGRKIEIKNMFPSTPSDGAIQYGNGFMCLSPMPLPATSSQIVLRENGVLKVKDILFSPQTYCSDRAVWNDTTEFYVYIFCTFKKCCSNNQAVYWNTNVPLSCVNDTAVTQKWSPKVYDQHSRLINNSEFPLGLFRTKGVMKCDIMHYRYLVDSKISFNLQVNGSVSVGDPFNLDFQFGNFCVDRTYVREELHTAIVVCVPPPAKLTFWNVICVTVTLTICICVLLFPFIVPKLYTTTMKLVMCHMTCEVFTYVFRTIAFAWGDLPMPVCKTYALTMQFLRLAGFFWINVMCIDMTSKFSGKLRAPSRGLRQPLCTKRFALYSLHAWGWPAVIVAVTAALDLAPGLADHPLRPYIGDITCSFHSLKTALLYYYGAVILLVLINIGLFIVTSFSIYRTKQEVLENFMTMDTFQSAIQIANREDQRSLVLYLKIFCLMGLTYVTEIIAWCDGSTFSSILMDVNSMMLSIFVFLLFCCKPQVVRERLEELKQRWRSLVEASTRQMARSTDQSPLDGR